MVQHTSQLVVECLNADSGSTNSGKGKVVASHHCMEQSDNRIRTARTIVAKSATGSGAIFCNVWKWHFLSLPARVGAYCIIGSPETGISRLAVIFGERREGVEEREQKP